MDLIYSWNPLIVTKRLWIYIQKIFFRANRRLIIRRAHAKFLSLDHQLFLCIFQYFSVSMFKNKYYHWLKSDLSLIRLTCSETICWFVTGKNFSILVPVDQKKQQSYWKISFSYSNLNKWYMNEKWDTTKEECMMCSAYQILKIFITTLQIAEHIIHPSIVVSFTSRSVQKHANIF